MARDVREETGITDKMGRMIKVGDVVQFALGGNSHDATREVIEKQGKRFVCVPMPYKVGGYGFKLDDHRARHLVVVDRL